MTPADLRQRVEEATPGPWYWIDRFVWGFEGPKIKRLSEAKISASDAALISLAPDLALALAEAWEALDGLVKHTEQFCLDRAPDVDLTCPAHKTGRAVLAKLEGLGA